MDLKRINIPRAVQLRVWKQDGWVCQLCGSPVFFGPALKRLSELSQGHGYYHQNGDHKKMLQLFERRWASVDHIKSFAKGGQNEEENYQTCCMRCNRQKSDKEEETAIKFINKIEDNSKQVGWDGLSSLYVKLTPKKDEWTKLLEAQQ